MRVQRLDLAQGSRPRFAGIRRTGLADIARRCGFARQTLYRYWPDAQSLFAALVTRELRAVIEDVADEPATLEELSGMLVASADRIRRMPLVDRLREEMPDLKVIFMSGYTGASNASIHKSLEMPGVAFLQKPFRLNNLISQVEELIGGIKTGG